MRRTALMGVEPGGELFRLVDQDFKVHPIPPDGLVLTTQLAKVLGVGPGSRVMLLGEGGRAVRREVETGQRNESEVEIRNGLREGDSVVPHTPNDLEDGARIEPQEEAAP